jgi:hypothetical protein
VAFAATSGFGILVLKQTIYGAIDKLQAKRLSEFMAQNLLAIITPPLQVV